jgi:uncharacterized protein involved in exopolysaccharide biosynthesis
MNDLFVDFNLRSEWDKLWARRTLILSVSAFTALCAIILTLPVFMKPEFKSTAVIFPPSISSVTQLSFTENGYRGIESGEVEDVDRIVSLLQAPMLKDMMAEKYNLYPHYGFPEPAGKKVSTASEKFYNAYDDKVKVKFTQYSTIQVDVYDTDSFIAASIANDYIKYADSFLEAMSGRKAGYAKTLEEIKVLSIEIDSIRDSVEFYRTNYNIYRVENLSEPVATYLYGSTKIKPEFHKNYDRAMALETQLFNLNLTLADLQKEKYFRKKNLDTYPSLLHVVNYAKPAEYKSRPKRTIILISTVGATLLAMIFAVLLLDRKRRPSLPI